MESIKTGKYIELAYKIYSIGKDNEKVLEYEFTKDRPDRFVFGVEPGILAEFSKNIQGLSAGDTFDFTLSPEKAFGLRDENLVIELDKNIFLDKEGKFNDDVVYVGNVLSMMTSDGYPAQGVVKAISDDKVTMDFNHRLAGANVEYEGSVELVRDATADDLPQQHGCGCGCDSCGDGGCDHDHEHEGCGGCGGCH